MRVSKYLYDIVIFANQVLSSDPIKYFLTLSLLFLTVHIHHYIYIYIYMYIYIDTDIDIYKYNINIIYIYNNIIYIYIYIYIYVNIIYIKIYKLYISRPYPTYARKTRYICAAQTHQLPQSYCGNCETNSFSELLLESSSDTA